MSEVELLHSLNIVDRRTFRQWARSNHPDKGGNEEFYVLVKEAYEKISSDETEEITSEEELSALFEYLCSVKVHSEYCECMVLLSDQTPSNLQIKLKEANECRYAQQRCSQLKEKGSSYCKFHKQFQF